MRIDRRRAEILDAAKQVFLAREYAAVTIDDIAESAAFSRATIYLYFKNKQEVYTGVLLRDLDQMISGLTDLFLRTDTVRNNLFRMSTSYMNFFRVHPEYFTTLSFFFFPGRKEVLPDDAAKKIKARLAEGISAIEECINLGIDRGRHVPSMHVPRHYPCGVNGWVMPTLPSPEIQQSTNERSSKSMQME